MVSTDGNLQNHFLIAMPGMRDERFLRSVIYLCAHGEDGAMGLMINQAQQLGFADVLVELGILERSQSIRLPYNARKMSVLNGGPVDRSRGFVLHSGDYMVDSSMAVSEQICLTATVDILRAISAGSGPRQAIMALGYSGWASGQLEHEIAENGWLAIPATPELLFGSDVDTAYDRILASMGIDPTHLSQTSGHA
ncbi:YqgE/AlgH family protein [Nitratireductor luteus]|uniref:YqgE/AlgH family protein n=1 Tax=Nitratireductor luteus TaxID=2976980 RepID=UPI00223FF3BB|nr:YqgE/AlgH family protein [Nitratireductor luteus]